MKVEVRILGSTDSRVFENVASGVFDRPIQVEYAREFLQDPRHHIAVATDDQNKIVGMASAFHYVHPDKPAQLFINEVGVAPSHRRCGIARRLLDELIKHGGRIGCKECWVATEKQNIAARALFASAGGIEAPDSIVMYTFGARNILPS